VGKQPSLEEHRKVEIQCHEFVVLEWQIAYSPTGRTQDCRNSNKVIHCKQTSKIPHKTPQSSHTPRLLKLHLEMRHIRITTASAKCRRDLRHTSIVTTHSKHSLTLKATPVGFYTWHNIRGLMAHLFVSLHDWTIYSIMRTIQIKSCTKLLDGDTSHAAIFRNTQFAQRILTSVGKVRGELFFVIDKEKSGDHFGVEIISGSIWGSFQGWGSFRD